MRLYLDSSALVKPVKLEPESGVLGRFLRRYRTDDRRMADAAASLSLVVEAPA